MATTNVYAQAEAKPPCWNGVNSSGWIKEGHYEYSKCMENLQKSDKEIGKYFCLVQNVVGIQWKDEFEFKEPPYAGKIKPREEKFFLTIKRDFHYKHCSNALALNLPLSNICSRRQYRYELESKSDNVPSGVLSENGGVYFSNEYGGGPMGQVFHLINNNFVAVTGLFNKYITHGICEKID